MKAHLLLVILVFGSYQGKVHSICSLVTKEKQIPFPDLFNDVDFYQLSVEFTIPGQSESIYFSEYYDDAEKQGRLDKQEEGENSKLYYFASTSEAFQVQGATCKMINIGEAPDFMLRIPYDWFFGDGKRVVYGPSSMFRNAYLMYVADKSKIQYMGETDDAVRGFRTKYWKRCLSNTMSVEYHFIGKDYVEAYGLNLTEIPIRVYIESLDDAATTTTLETQNYEILSFLPVVTEDTDLFELPPGYGCTEYRNASDDSPDIPTFENNNLMIYGEATYINKTNQKSPTYLSTFMLALDLSTVHMAYIYTPWSKPSGAVADLEAKPQVFAVFDIKNKYVYLRNYATDECFFIKDKKFPPRYYFPGDFGYVDLSDPALLFQNNEFLYIGEGTERGLKVNIFEAVFKDYNLGNKVVPEVIATHSYLKPGEVLVGYNTVPEALIKIEMHFNDYTKIEDKLVKKPLAELKFHLFGFSTVIPYRNRIFDVRSCFKNNDQSMWITVGFQAEQEQIFKLKKSGPDVEENILNDLYLSTELTPIRAPLISVEYTDDSVLAIILILERPPFQLDFSDIKNDTTIAKTTEVEGIMSPQGCANKCLEESSTCWGFAICGVTCYIGLDESNETKAEKDCTLYKRADIVEIPSMEVIGHNIEELVQQRRLRLMIPVGSDDPPVELIANYFEEYTPDESDEFFDLMGKELNPRLRVLKVASKLDDKAGNLVKNFGQLSYAECQRVCLDFKECETVSYCLGQNFQCLVSTTYGEDIPKSQIKQDYFCTILTRKYSDKFSRSPGNVLSQVAKKTLSLPKSEDCARACVKETSFKCLSFDNCPPSKDKSCRLHTVHFLDQKTKEGAVTNENVCGHYSRKFSIDFSSVVNKKTVGNGFLSSKDVTLEECAKECVDYNGGKCSGFDFCQDTQVFATSCFVLTANPSEMKTAYSPICTHYMKENLAAPSSKAFSNATAGGLGFLFFIIGGVLGALIVFGIAYYRVNRSS